MFNGKVIHHAPKYGNVQISRAVDNAGNDLIVQRAERPGGFVTNALPDLRAIEPPNPAGRPSAMPFLFPRPAETKPGAAPQSPAAEQKSEPNEAAAGDSRTATTGGTPVPPNSGTIARGTLSLPRRKPASNVQ